MKKLLLLIFTLSILSTMNFYSQNVDNPKNPDDPVIINDDTQTKDEISFNVKYKKQNGQVKKGSLSDLSNIYLDLVWTGNENGSEQILFDLIKSINIKGYTMKKKTKENLSIVYYFPYLFDITLKDGTIIKDAKGRIEEIEQFMIFTKIGKEKCFTYFIRYWLEDKGYFNDNKSKNYEESPSVPGEVITYLEFN